MDKEIILHKEIDIIQAIITRMANNSFLLKGWLISLIAVILAVSKESAILPNIIYLGIILCLPVIVFWYLDAFFLHKEKCYRKLYEWVIGNRKNSEEFLYSLDYKRFEKEVDKIPKIMRSNTLLPFYGITLLALIVFVLYNLVK